MYEDNIKDGKILCALIGSVFMVACMVISYFNYNEPNTGYMMSEVGFVIVGLVFLILACKDEYCGVVYKYKIGLNKWVKVLLGAEVVFCSFVIFDQSIIGRIIEMIPSNALSLNVLFIPVALIGGFIIGAAFKLDKTIKDEEE